MYSNFRFSKSATTGFLPIVMSTKDLGLFTANSGNSAADAANLQNYISNHRVQMMELPAMIFVETRFITQNSTVPVQIGAMHSIDTTTFNVQCSEDTDSVEEISYDAMPALGPLTNDSKTFADVGVSATTSQADAGTLTDSPYPNRDREQQTDVEAKNVTTVAIQCNLEDDLFVAMCEEGAEAGTDTATSKEDEKQKFLQYVTTNTQNHSNGKQECLMCGEIKINSKAMTAHLAGHWGPPALCCDCGIYFENSTLLLKHKCEMKRRRPRKSNKPFAAGRFICPHYRCPVTTISPQELYDHINEHSALRGYRCHGCQRVFATSGELRRHLPLRLKCLEMAKRSSISPYKPWNSKQEASYRVRVFALHSAKRKQLLVKTFLSQRTSVRKRCQICLVRCSNSFKYAKHTKRCLKNFRYRLHKKRTPPPPLKLENGYGH